MTSDEEFKINLSKTMGKNEAMLASLTEDVHDIKKDVKAITEHNDRVIKDVQDHLQRHFDSKISSCKGEVMTLLAEGHLNKEQTRDKITKAIQANNERIWGKVKIAGYTAGFLGAVIGFIVEYGEMILAFLEFRKSGGSE